jgi:glycerophosphoryl diester phosphodiesterase
MSDISWLAKRPIAHRGFHDLNDKRWENTLSAFEAATERGYAIECDVRLSSDGVPVVIHDHGLQRLTGADGAIWQRTAREITALKVGGTADHVPTLKEMLDLVHGRVPLVVELKGTPGHDDGLVAHVCEMLRAYGGKAAIMSFDHWLIRQFPAHARDIPTGLTACGSLDHELEAHFSMLMHDISFVSYGVFDLPNRFVTFVRQRLAMPVVSWTVRERGDIERTFAHADQITFEGFEPDSTSM